MRCCVAPPALTQLPQTHQASASYSSREAAHLHSCQRCGAGLTAALRASMRSRPLRVYSSGSFAERAVQAVQGVTRQYRRFMAGAGCKAGAPWEGPHAPSLALCPPLPPWHHWLRGQETSQQFPQPQEASNALTFRCRSSWMVA